MESATGPGITRPGIGSSKGATVIARKTPEGVEILGMGICPTEGMRKGSVVNVDATVKSIRQSVSEAEKMTGLPVSSALVGVSGPLIKSFNSHAAVSVRNEREVTDTDVARVLDLAKAVELPADREILHVLTQEFIVDDMPGIKDPRGMTGIRLDARVHVVTDDLPSTRNLVRCVEKAEINIVDIVLSPLASAEAGLTPAERAGGGVGCRTPAADAESLKIASGCAAIQKVRRDELVELPGVGGRQPRPIRRQYLSEIIEPRAEEIFTLLRKEILRSGFEEMLGAGIVLTGGGSRLDGLPDLGERVFHLPVRRGGPIGIGGVVEVVNSPTFATAVGLALYGAKLAESGMGRVEEEAPGGWMARVKRILSEFF